MNEWQPHDLCSCVGSEWIGNVTAIANAAIVILYGLIGRLWWNAACAASDSGKWVWLFLLAIFIVCSQAGYMVNDLSMIAPRTAVILRLVLLAVQIVLCSAFLYSSAPFNFVLSGKHERLEHDIAAAVENNASDAHIASLSRALFVKMKLTRIQGLSDKLEQHIADATEPPQ